MVKKLRLLPVFIGVLCLSNYSLFGQQTTTYNGEQYHFDNNKWYINVPGASRPYQVIENRISIKYNTLATTAAISNFESSNNLFLLRKASTGWTDYAIGNYTGTIFNFAQSLQNSPLTQKVEISSGGELFQVPDDPNFSVQWALDQANNVDMNLPQAWDIATGDPSVKIAIIDSGIDFNIDDLGEGNDNYQNIHLNMGEDAWSDPENPNTGDGIDNDMNGFVDDWKGYNFGYGTNDTRSINGIEHGSVVATIAAAKTNNNTGISGVAGGWNGPGAQIIPISIERIIQGQDSAPFEPDAIDDAILYAVAQGADIICFSLGIGPREAIDEALQIAHDAGVVIIAGSGNSNSDTHIAYPANHPLTISVGGTTEQDLRWENNPNFDDQGVLYYTGSNGGIHSDIVAPAVNIAGIKSTNTVVQPDGTSFASPLVSGVVALMLSANPCLSNTMVREILHATAQKTGNYDYNWNPDNPGHSLIQGFGRVDAYEAVKAAQNLNSNSPDLSIRDHTSDIGTDAGYTFTWDFDQSPDIWARNQNDGHINQFSEDLEYSINSPRYIYVRVTNRSCVPTSGTEKVALYASSANSSSSWPNNWTSFSSGGQIIGDQPIGILQPGETKIIEIEWAMTFNTDQCLLARIENSTDDPITPYPDDLPLEIYQNNNIALRNVIVYDLFGGLNPPIFDNNIMPNGSAVIVGNHDPVAKNYDFEFFAHNYESGKPLTTAAEVTLHFDNSGWNIMKSAFERRTDCEILADKVVRVKSAHLKVNPISIPANTSFPIYVSFAFLTDEITNQSFYEYHVVQKHTAVHPVLGDHWTGGVHFSIRPPARPPFSANAGDDKGITDGETALLKPITIGEPATYNWYNSNQELVYTGTQFIASPASTETYTLEVIADSDGFKDYDEVTVTVSPYYLQTLAPNPVSTNLSVSFKVTGAATASLLFVKINDPTETYTFPISTRLSSMSINVSEWSTGPYKLILICDGQIVDDTGLIVE